ncbi:MAG: hypothetical protein ACHQ1G_07575 [Planctomycetota bacterium]
MANPFDGDKRYTEIEFAPGKWDHSIGANGVVTWTPKPGNPTGCNAVITKSDGTTQTHNNCQPGSTIETTHGTAVVHVV